MTSTARKIASNTLSILTGKAVDAILSLVLAVTLVRYLGPDDYGRYSLIYVAIGLLQWLPLMGMDKILIRDIARSPQIQNSLMAKAHAISLMSGLTAYLILILSASVFKPSYTALFAIGGIELALTPLTIRWVLMELNLEKIYSEIAVRSGKALFVVASLTLIYFRASLPAFIGARAASQVLTALLMYLLARRYGPYKMDFNFKGHVDLLKKSAPMALSHVNTLIHHNIDQVILYSLLGTHYVGIYAAAVRICRFLNIIPSTFTSNLFPLMSKVKDEKELEKTISTGSRILAIISAPVVLFTALWAKDILILLFGHPYAEGGRAFSILAYAMLFTFFGQLTMHIMIVINKVGIYAWAVATTAAMNVLLNYLFIPHMGMCGAALATLISYFWSAVGLYLLVPNTRKYTWHAIYSSIRPFVMAGIIIVPAVLKIHMFVSLILIAVLYPAVLWISGSLGEEEKDFIKKVVRAL